MSKGLTHTTRSQSSPEDRSGRLVNRLRMVWVAALVLALIVPARMSTVSACDLMFDDSASLAASSDEEPGASSTGLGIASLVEIVWAPLDLPSKISEITTYSARHWWSARSGAEKGLILEGLARAVAVGAAVVSDAFDGDGAPEMRESAGPENGTDDREEAASLAGEMAEDEAISGMPGATSGERAPSSCESSDSL